VRLAGLEVERVTEGVDRREGRKLAEIRGEDGDEAVGEDGRAEYQSPLVPSGRSLRAAGSGHHAHDPA
jgi:hypothetical protein